MLAVRCVFMLIISRIVAHVAKERQASFNLCKEIRKING